MDSLDKLLEDEINALNDDEEEGEFDLRMADAITAGISSIQNFEEESFEEELKYLNNFSSSRVTSFLEASFSETSTKKNEVSDDGLSLVVIESTQLPSIPETTVCVCEEVVELMNDMLFSIEQIIGASDRVGLVSTKVLFDLVPVISTVLHDEVAEEPDDIAVIVETDAQQTVLDLDSEASERLIREQLEKAKAEEEERFRLHKLEVERIQEELAKDIALRQQRKARLLEEIDRQRRLVSAVRLQCWLRVIYAKRVYHHRLIVYRNEQLIKNCDYVFIRLVNELCVEYSADELSEQTKRHIEEVLRLEQEEKLRLQLLELERIERERVEQERSRERVALRMMMAEDEASLAESRLFEYEKTMREQYERVVMPREDSDSHNIRHFLTKTMKEEQNDAFKIQRNAMESFRNQFERSANGLFSLSRESYEAPSSGVSSWGGRVPVKVTKSEPPPPQVVYNAIIDVPPPTTDAPLQLVDYWRTLVGTRNVELQTINERVQDFICGHNCVIPSQNKSSTRTVSNKSSSLILEQIRPRILIAGLKHWQNYWLTTIGSTNVFTARYIQKQGDSIGRVSSVIQKLSELSSCCKRVDDRGCASPGFLSVLAPLREKEGSIQMNVESLGSINEGLSNYRKQISKKLAVDCFPEVRKLEMNVNSLSTMDGVEKLPCVEDISCKHNKISYLSALRTLSSSVSSGSLFYKGVSSPPSICQLKSLKLESNKLSDESLATLFCWTEYPLFPLLEVLVLSTNNLSYVPSFNIHCPLLQKLDLYHNNITSMTDHRGECGLAALPALSLLNLGRNKLEFIDGNMFTGCPLLSTLILSQNSLTSVPFPMWLPLLRELRLNDNKLSNLCQWEVNIMDTTECWPPLFVPMLERLYLHDNKIDTIPFTCLVGAPNVTVIDLSFNSITRLDAIRGIASCVKVSSLLLNDNDITAPFMRKDTYRCLSECLPCLLEASSDNVTGSVLGGRVHADKTSLEFCVSVSEDLLVKGSSSMNGNSGTMVRDGVLNISFQSYDVNYSDIPQYLMSSEAGIDSVEGGSDNPLLQVPWAALSLTPSDELVFYERFNAFICSLISNASVFRTNWASKNRTLVNKLCRFWRYSELIGSSNLYEPLLFSIHICKSMVFFTNTTELELIRLIDNEESLLAEVIVDNIPLFESYERAVIGKLVSRIQALARGYVTKKRVRKVMQSIKYVDDELDEILGGKKAVKPKGPTSMVKDIEANDEEEFDMDNMDVNDLLMGLEEFPDDWMGAPLTASRNTGIAEADPGYQGNNMVYGDHIRKRASSSSTPVVHADDTDRKGLYSHPPYSTHSEKFPPIAKVEAWHEKNMTEARPISAMTESSNGTEDIEYDDEDDIELASRAVSEATTRSEAKKLPPLGERRLQAGVDSDTPRSQHSVVGTSKIAAEWGISDPAVLATIAKRNQKLRKMKQAVDLREKEKDANYRYNKFLKNSFGPSDSSLVSPAGNGGGGSFGGKPKNFRGGRKVVGKKNTVPISWLQGPSGGDDHEEDFEEL